MRERRAHDWRVDLGRRHALESRVALALHGDPQLIVLQRCTSSTERLDFQLLGPGERLVELELKSKRQPYQGWSCHRPNVPEEDLFILDELALRRIVEAGRYAFLLVNDMPKRRWCLWSAADLVLTSKARVARKLVTDQVRDKGKLLLDLTEQTTISSRLEHAVRAVAEMVSDVDRRWNDIAPWPGGGATAQVPERGRASRE